jgi:hypothetical protein
MTTYQPGWGMSRGEAEDNGLPEFSLNSRDSVLPFNLLTRNERSAITARESGLVFYF